MFPSGAAALFRYIPASGLSCRVCSPLFSLKRHGCITCFLGIFSYNGSCDMFTLLPSKVHVFSIVRSLHRASQTVAGCLLAATDQPSVGSPPGASKPHTPRRRAKKACGDAFEYHSAQLIEHCSIFLSCSCYAC